MQNVELWLFVFLYSMTLVKDAGLAVFGERWASDAGYASLIFDYRCFGESGGEPRNLVDLQRQLEDYRSVITWARHHAELFRNDKIVVMGSAISGLNVAALALEDSGLAGAMAHSPVLDGELYSTLHYERLGESVSLLGYGTLMASPADPRFLFWMMVDWVKEKLGLAPVFVKAIGRPGEFSFLSTPSCHPGNL